MEMEHINENTIRVLIKSEDLAARGITFLDLLGNHKEIENFFYSILEEVDVNDEFKGSEAVTFQVLPKGDGLELFISKNASLENMDPYEVYGDYYSPEEITDWLKNEDPESYEGFSQEEMMDWFKNQLPAKKEKNETESVPVTRELVFEVGSFEAMIQLATEIELEDVVTNLYLMNGMYYLDVFFLEDSLTDKQIENHTALLSEFARKSTVTPDYLVEHGETIMEMDAIGMTKRYFLN
ncbi:adapter protein MecA 1/2 [Enterococcus sp. DIV2402]|jgi:adapter protein MecA 1/2|uniref:Adapter protein MecA n=1 Tax=Candidatus Enterococcus lowellii TaxID=2230877 RepID=A0ABZ2SR85_9ENTE|nr:adaptor protein MecA [Enterococcus sp. DIV2402]MBO0465397.1 adaptor protein MecA [Enterococcus sp. DIV2402]